MSQICNVCGNKLRIRFPRVVDPITMEEFAIHNCKGCGLGHTVPQPMDTGRYYGPSYYGNRHGITAQYCIKRRMGFVAAAMNEKSGNRLLDIGCGDGSFLLSAKKAGWEVTGTEMNPKSARKAGLDVKETLEELVNGREYDCITLWHSLEHMRDIRYTLAQLAGLLTPNGKILIAVPDNEGIQSKLFGPRWLHLDVPRHLYHFDADSLSFCLASAGLNTLAQWHQEFEYDAMGWSQSALNCIFPTPNLFFDYLTGKKETSSTIFRTSIIAFGSMVTILSFPAVAWGTLLRRGGTLVTVAGHSKPA